MPRHSKVRVHVMLRVKSAVLAVVFLAVPVISSAGPLTWPIGCIPGMDCAGSSYYVGYPDIGATGKAFNCGAPGYTGHTGTDVVVSSIEAGVPVYAAADGEVLWVAGGRFDHCPNTDEPDCRTALSPQSAGNTGRISEDADANGFCSVKEGCFSWGFDAGNYVLVGHRGLPDVSATLYAHLRTGSLAVMAGQRVKKGQKLGEVGSSGASLLPHLHFGVFAKTEGGNRLTDPWAGQCGPNIGAALWQYDPPFRADITVERSAPGDGVVTDAGGVISCGSGCVASFIPGTVVTLTAVPYFGTEFVGWEGACSGASQDCSFVAAGKQNARAVFRRVTSPGVSVASRPPARSSN